jgi:hypothetical protein
VRAGCAFAFSVQGRIAVPSSSVAHFPFHFWIRLLNLNRALRISISVCNFLGFLSSIGAAVASLDFVCRVSSVVPASTTLGIRFLRGKVVVPRVSLVRPFSLGDATSACSAGAHTMSKKVKLLTLEEDESQAQLVGPLMLSNIENYQNLREFLLRIAIVPWPFNFWDVDSTCRIPLKLEPFNVVGDEVYVVRESEFELRDTKRRRLEAIGETEVLEDTLQPDAEILDVPAISGDPQPPQGSRVSDSGSDICENDLKSIILPAEVKAKYLQAAKKLKKELESISLEDHNWHLKSWDSNGVAVVKLWCGECSKEFGGASGDHTKSAVYNLFMNFKKSHLLTTLHIRAYCRRKGINFDDHPQSAASKGKAVVMTAADHKRAVVEGMQTLEDLNAARVDEDGPFVLVGNPEDEDMKCWWFKVRCKVCGDLFQLCPPKKNLAANLENHVTGIKHLKAFEDSRALGKSSSLPALTGRRGRTPSFSKGSKGNQPDLHGWFRTSCISEELLSAASNEGNSVSFLPMLCWGYADRVCEYAGKSFCVSRLLMDPKPGKNWFAEPHTRGTVGVRGNEKMISGCFRHVNCSRLSSSGFPFTHFCCHACNQIPQEMDFRLRVVREDAALEKRGCRGTGDGRRIGFLSMQELANHSRVTMKRLRNERRLRWYQKAMLVRLAVTRPKLRITAEEALVRKDVVKFCNDIIAAHRTGAFGGKPALWDFMRDVTTNLRRKKQGHRFSKNSKCFVQAMKIYGGRRMCDLFTLNFAGPSYTTVKRENKKGVQFVPGEHPQIFACVAQIYKEAKSAHGIRGPVPVILAEDETKVKTRVAWEPQRDTLAGFCGWKDEHQCCSTFKPVVGGGEGGYNSIIQAFRDAKMGGFARVIMVNPLHSSLPRLALVVSCTCNSFDSNWVRKQWDLIDQLWAVECASVVGPIIGHASDGDSRRRQLMLRDYTSKSGPRFAIPWVGWMLSASSMDGTTVTGLHDQDFIHNGKKLINPLDSPVRVLQLGLDVCALEHIGLVYHRFSYDDHGLALEDIQRSDRQNWASAQRLCSAKTRHCLRELREAQDVHRERTLGTEMYLQICADYIDIFLSTKLDLQSRIVLAGKVSFFFRIWRLWLQFGDHSLGGNTRKLTLSESFVSMQCFFDVQISCHFVVLLICHFRDVYGHLPVPLHLTGSDSCEIFFSKIGGMCGMERAYDFQELLNCTNALNHLAAIEYGENGLKFPRAHNKQKNIWADMHPLAEGEVPAVLDDYSLIKSDEDVVLALKEGLKEAQAMIRTLNMAPSVVARNKKWYLEPWVVEQGDPKFLSYSPSAKAVPG